MIDFLLELGASIFGIELSNLMINASEKQKLEIELLQRQKEEGWMPTPLEVENECRRLENLLLQRELEEIKRKAG